MPHFFISYRRSDREGQYLAHMIFRELCRRYGEASVFLDVDKRSPGLSFPVKVEQALSITDVVLVIIGPAWLQLLTERQDDSRDWVRYEVAESLKRTGLPVVPVCRAGVKIPQPHELPEDLKDLGWRDGVTLDPFEDFDSHLTRLLSDVERVLETNRAAAAEAAKLAAQEAARAKAAEAERAAAEAEKKSIEKAMPALPSGGKASVPRLDPNPAPATPSKSTSITPPSLAPKVEASAAVQSRRVSPLASTGAVAKPLPAKYYDFAQNDRFTLIGVTSSLLISGLMVSGLAFGYSNTLLGLPFVQANFVLTFLYGLLAGNAAGRALRWCRVRKSGVATLVGLADGVFAVYSSCVVWVYGHLGLFKTTGFVGLLDLAFSPVPLWHLLRGINERGAWAVWGYKPTGGALWFNWSLEAVVIIGLSTLAATIIVDIADVYCELCGTRCKEHYGVAKLRSCDRGEIKNRLEAKDFAFLEALGAPPPGANKWLSLTLKSCEKCGTTNSLNVFTEANSFLVFGLLLTSAECAKIRRIGREAAASAKQPSR